MEPLARKEAVATILGAMIATGALVVAVLQWQCPKVGPVAPTESAPEADFTEKEEAEEVLKPPNEGHRVASRPANQRQEPTPAVLWATSSAPIEFALADGEQKVLLSGQAAVAAEFGKVGEEEFVTIRIHTGQKTENYAVLNPGARFEFSVGKEFFYLSVLRIDAAARQALLRIDHSRRIQEVP